MTNGENRPYRYKAFISYNHNDRKFAKYLHTKLENYASVDTNSAKGKKPLSPIFLDQNELRAGSTLSTAIQEALKASEFLVVICSENSVASRWVKDEISFMKALGAGSKIIGVIPDKYGDETHIDAMIGEESEHLGADFRPGNNKYLQLSKIAATMSDVDLDTLYKRANRRKNKQMLFLTTGLTAIALTMSGLAAQAQLAEREAVRQRQHSEDVIAFMIDEFRDDLESLDRLDVLDEIGQKAQTYFEDRDLKSLSGRSVLLQSRTLRQLSDVDEKRGNLLAAKERIIGARKASAHMVAKHPQNLDAVFEHAENTELLVYLEYQIGDLVKAEALSHEALAIYDKGLSFFPNNEELRWERSLAEQNVGVMLLQSGKANEAGPYFQRSLDATKSMTAKRVLTEDELYDYVNLYTWYIRSLPDDTALSFLYETRLNQVDLLRQMSGTDAPSIKTQSETLNVERAIVQLLLNMGREAEAQSLMLSIQDNFEKLLAHDPENVGWRRHLVRSKLTLARTRNKQGKIEARNQLLEDVQMLTKKPNGYTWQMTTDIVLGINRLEARKLYDEGSADAAIMSLEQDEKVIREYRKEKIRPRDKHNIASLNDLKSELLTRQLRDSEARTAAGKILTLLSGKNSYSIAEQKMQLAAYDTLGRAAESKALKRKLESLGVVYDRRSAAR